jgi:aminoglycoside phosphotransferase (APT) family kinase protein
MSTIGHPLSDLTNLINTYITAISGPNPHAGFVPNAVPGLPSQDQVVSWYAEEAAWNPQSDLAWGVAFSIFRQAIIMQGIAARVAQRQASSAEAKLYAQMFRPYAENAWKLVVEARGRARL